MNKLYRAEISEFTKIIEDLENQLESAGVSVKVISQISVACDEIFTNVSSYAYESGNGNIEISTEVLDNPLRVEIEFKDSGVPFNPLEMEDPDVTLSAEERKIGGLGIFMVRKMMDDVKYKYADGKNILTIMKKA